MWILLSHASQTNPFYDLLVEKSIFRAPSGKINRLQLVKIIFTSFH